MGQDEKTITFIYFNVKASSWSSLEVKFLVQVLEIAQET